VEEPRRALDQRFSGLPFSFKNPAKIRVAFRKFAKVRRALTPVADNPTFTRISRFHWAVRICLGKNKAKIVTGFSDFYSPVKISVTRQN
jgi:hypothetical protein